MRAVEREEAPSKPIMLVLQIQMSQAGVCCEGRGKRRNTSPSNHITTQFQGNQGGGVFIEGRGKRRSAIVMNKVVT